MGRGGGRVAFSLFKKCEALSSGRYTQGHTRLVDDHKSKSCLALLASLSLPSNEIPKERITGRARV